MSKVYRPDSLDEGPADAVFTAVSVGVPRSAKGFVLVLN
jgi:hypothetical protein